jgi:hypothetical protein
MTSPNRRPLKNTTTATIRTTINGTVLTAIAALITRLAHVDVSVDELLPYVPFAVPVIGVFYRASLWLTDKVPALGFILFGKRDEPVY